MRKQVYIWTDGGAKPNPGSGGWAALLRFGSAEREISGYAKETTNNRMELIAAIEALKALKEPCKVLLHTDSKYLRNGIMFWIQRWKANNWMTTAQKPVLNQGLWIELYKLIQVHEVEWVWVKGHATCAENSRVDRLATKAREEGENNACRQQS